MIQNTNQMAIATERGITIQDMSRTLTNANPREEGNKISLDEVL
jgi:hypothetical protein